MRYRAVAAVTFVSGTLAVAAVAIPAAQAAGSGRPHAAAPHAAHAAPAVHPADTMDVTFSQVNVDKGVSGVAVGTTNTVHVPYTYTLTATGVDPTSSKFSTSLDLYRGTTTAMVNDLSGGHATCHAGSGQAAADGAVTETCSGTVDIHPHDLTIPDAGAHWQAVVYAFDAAGGGWAQQGGFTAPTLRRYSKLTVNATPEPVTKGKKVTVVGKLSRANWDLHGYYGYTVQPVKLQFRKKNSDTYTTLKTLTTDGHGQLKTTSTATVDGYWRFQFAGTATTPAVTTYGDYVDVR